jgi:hypothetical protein
MSLSAMTPQYFIGGIVPNLGISVQARCERSKSDHREIRVGPNSAVGKYLKALGSRLYSAAITDANPRSAMHGNEPATRRRKFECLMNRGTLLTSSATKIRDLCYKGSHEIASEIFVA